MNHLLDHLDKLHAFVMIADSGSLQAAARHLRLSQPAVSLKLKTLESAAGFQLFTRSKRGVELTQAGHNLYRFSKRLISDTELLALEMKGGLGRVRIGTFDIIVRMIARDLCDLETFLDITFRTESFRTERAGLALLDALDKDEIDIAIVDDPPIITGFEYQKLAPSPFGLFATKARAKALPKAATALLAALRNAPLIYISGGTAYEHVGAGKTAPKSLIDSFVEQLGLGSGRRIRVDSYALGLEMTEQGHGVGLLLAGHLLDRLQSGALVELAHASLPMPFSSMLCMVRKTAGDRSQAAAAWERIERVFQRAVATYQASKEAPRR